MNNNCTNKRRLQSPALFLLSAIMDRTAEYGYFGDVEELYRTMRERKGKFRAAFWLWRQVILTLPAFFFNSCYWGFAMFKNYLKTTMRSLKKQKIFTLINITGLAIGMACCILIFLFVQDDLGFDSFHEKGDRIYRVYTESVNNGTQFIMAPTMMPFAPAAKEEFPEIEKIARIKTGHKLISKDGRKFNERVFYADTDFFSIFSFELKEGDPLTALKEPYSVVLTDQAVIKYFGNENPMGKSLKFENKDIYTVTGILKKIPKNSHLRFTVLASFCTYEAANPFRSKMWGSFGNEYTYMLLKENADPAELEKKFPALLKKHLEGEDVQTILHLQPLSEIHFSDFNYDAARTIPAAYLYIFAAIALFILTIACINFINLSTAKSSSRAKEVCLRKVVGAVRGQLIKQFLGESVFMSVCACLIAVALVWLILPEFNRFSGKGITINVLHNAGFIFAALIITGVTGIAAGSYPAIYLSGIKPVKALKNAVQKRTGGLSFRAVLVVFQFVISVFLIIGTMTIYSQIEYLVKKNVGFEKDQIVVFRIGDTPVEGKLDVFAGKLRENSSILNVSLSSGTPASGASSTSYFRPEGWDENKPLKMLTVFTDYNFAQTYGLSILSGRDFSKEFSTDAENACIVNQTAAQTIGWDDPLGKIIKSDDKTYTVVGVMQDFNYYSLHSAISPTMLLINPDRFWYLSVRIDAGRADDAIGQIKSVWKEFAPDFPLDFNFMDDMFAGQYRAERRISTILLISTILAIIISCLGIFGLISFTTEQKTKEIGIRKALGASAPAIVYLVSRQIFKWIFVANLMACPLAYFAMRAWLNSYAYKTELGAGLFISAAVLSAVVALISILWQAVKASLAHPVDSLRYE